MQAERLVEGILTSRERSLGLLHPWKWQAEISLSEAPDRRVQVFFEFMRSLCAAMCLPLSLSLSLSLSLFACFALEDGASAISVPRAFEHPYC